MSDIKVKTSKENRFGKTIHISGVAVTFDSNGIAEVKEEDVSSVLGGGVELVDKSAKFSSKEEKDLIEKQEGLLAKAKAEAEKIIEDAKEKAKEIIEEAQKQAKIILIENKVDEKAELEASLQSKSLEDIKKMCEESHIPAAALKKFKTEEDKPALIEFTMNAVFGSKENA